MENQEIKSSLKEVLPNSTAVLVLGILSIVFCCCCYGIIGLALSIIAVVLASKSNKLYISSPESFTEGSYKNMKAGKICAIIGICFSAIFLIIGLGYIILFGTAALTGFNEVFMQELMNNY
jgi:uncharacterized protein MpPF26